VPAIPTMMTTTMIDSTEPHPSLAGYTPESWRSLLPAEALPFWAATIAHIPDARPGSYDLMFLADLCWCSYFLAELDAEIERIKPGRRPKLLRSPARPATSSAPPGLPARALLVVTWRPPASSISAP
jgi:hypothetical protein